MDKEHKDWIQSHFVEILQNTNLERLLQHVKRKNIFPDIILERYHLPNVTPHEKKRQFYLDIQKRGPKAYSLLLEACQESSHDKLYTILNTEPSNSATNIDVQVDDTEKHARPFFHSSFDPDKNSEALLKTMEENPDTTILNLGTDTRKIEVKTTGNFMDDPKASSHKSLTPYPMRGFKRGIAFVINNISFLNDGHKLRRGAEVDTKNLKELFRQLKFEWIYWENQTHRDIENKLREFTKDPILRDVDSCFVIVMSHGTEGSCPEDTHIITYDNLDFKTTEIVNKFSNRNCPLLRNKPKIIVFQACRGGMQDYGVKQSQVSINKLIIENKRLNIEDNVESDGESEETMSIMSDILICYTSYAGYKSYRDKYLGAWFIQHFCETFMDQAHDTDVKKLFDIISYNVDNERTKEDARQSAYIATIKFRPCFLNPGVYVPHA